MSTFLLKAGYTNPMMRSPTSNPSRFEVQRRMTLEQMHNFNNSSDTGGRMYAVDVPDSEDNPVRYRRLNSEGRESGRILF